ncbi:nuclease-related domain-containing protein [Streptomyces sp. CRN 30]|uniref:nuclease-related domain-containing protein n=1 Tax=Streptomyces sp. CRN 30 TaxID=3075613 RepID=UPI002A83998A|nr:nuclease-related domain-containing protein [Streptomyces sp. CRN 30]
MSFTALLLVAAAGLYFTVGRDRLRALARRIRSRSRHGGAGASAAARARQLRTPTVRLAEHLGIPTRRGRQAARWAAGAEGERRTAVRLAPLTRAGWTILHDRALPGSPANLDHLAISPHGVVVLPDTKRWSARWPVTETGGRLFHGDLDVTGRLNGLRYEAARVAELLGTRVIPVALVDGAPLPDGPLRLNGIAIVPAEDACHHLRALARLTPAPPRDGPALAALAASLFPPYHQGHRR